MAQPSLGSGAVAILLMRLRGAPVYGQNRFVRKCIAWLVAIPLMLAGTEVAHFLAFRFVYPNALERSLALQQSGHGYFSWLPAFGGIALAVLLSAVFWHGRNARNAQGRSTGHTPLSRFAILPPLAFALQEHLEALIHTGSISGVVVSPTFMIGLLLQLPVALLSYLVARLLLGAAERVGRALADRPATYPAPPLCESPSWFTLTVWPLRSAVLADGHAGRGPPVAGLRLATSLSCC
jgi:acyl-CoA synthetase (AMP-forming)/AMP-acid ligase II